LPSLDRLLVGGRLVSTFADPERHGHRLLYEHHPWYGVPLGQARQCIRETLGHHELARMRPTDVLRRRSAESALHHISGSRSMSAMISSGPERADAYPRHSRTSKSRCARCLPTAMAKCWSPLQMSTRPVLTASRDSLLPRTAQDEATVSHANGPYNNLVFQE